MRIAPAMRFSPHLTTNNKWFAYRLRGFTLIEMMIVIAILAIFASIAVPSFNDAILSGKLRAYANDMVASTHLARSEALKRNAVVRLCASSNGTSCSGDWKDGWIVLSSTDAVIQTQQGVDANYKITGNVNTLSFQPTGVGSTQATLTICRETPQAGSQERVVTISATGRASVTRTSTGSC